MIAFPEYNFFQKYILKKKKKRREFIIAFLYLYIYFIFQVRPLSTPSPPRWIWADKVTARARPSVPCLETPSPLVDSQSQLGSKSECVSVCEGYYCREKKKEIRKDNGGEHIGVWLPFNVTIDKKARDKKLMSHLNRTSGYTSPRTAASTYRSVVGWWRWRRSIPAMLTASRPTIVSQLTTKLVSSRERQRKKKVWYNRRLLKLIDHAFIEPTKSYIDIYILFFLFHPKNQGNQTWTW